MDADITFATPHIKQQAKAKHLTDYSGYSRT